MDNVIVLKSPELSDCKPSHLNPNRSQPINRNSKERENSPSKSLNKVLASSNKNTQEDSRETFDVVDKQDEEEKLNKQNQGHESQPQPVIYLEDKKLKPNKDSLNKNNYELVQEKSIAKGGNGTIYLVRKGKDDNYAMKIIVKPRDDERLRRVLREVEIFKGLRYRFLVKPAENCSFEDEDYIYIVMKYHRYYVYIIIVMVI